LVTFPPALNARLEDFRFDRRFRSDAAAIRHLVTLGLEIALQRGEQIKKDATMEESLTV